MRAHISDHCARRALESQEAGGGARGPDLRVRHQQHEARRHRRHQPQPEWSDPLLRSPQDKTDSSKGICALTPTHDPSYLVYPLPQPTAPPQQQLPSHVPPSTHSPAQPQSGSLLIADATTHTPLNVIEAHRAPLSCIAVSSSGTLLATASEKGTIIRVFELPSGKKLAQFRRGTMPARVCSMAFNGTGSLLVVSSVTETVHVFKLSDGARGLAASNFLGGRPAAHTRTGSRTSMGSATLSDDEPGSPGFDSDAARPTPAHRNPSGSADMAARAHDGSFSGMLRRTSQSVGKTFAASVAGYLPTSVTEMLEPARDFAWFKLPRVGSSGADVSSPGADSNHNNSNNGGGNGRDASPPTTTGRMSHLVGFGSRAAAGALGAATGSGGGGSAAHGPLKSVVGMSRNAPQVMAVTSEGMFLVYNIDLEHGGEGVLVRKSSILDDSGDSLSAARAFAGSDASRGMPTGPAGMAARRRSSVRDGESGLAGMGLSP